MEILCSETMNNDVRLLIFDLDGTLADTIDSIREGVNLAMRKYGYPERSYEEVREAIGNGARNLIRQSMPRAAAQDEALVDRVFSDYHTFYGQTFAHCDRCYDGMIEALCELKKLGYTIAVLSNKQDEYVRALIKNLIPEGVVSVAMGQTELPRKPDPTVPLLIAQGLGFAPAETAFIGDSEVDVQTGLNAGMVTVGCSWGYRSRALLVEGGAHAVLDEPTELTALFS